MGLYTTELKLVTKEEWFAALRSGTYKRGREGLYRQPQDSFCCLGVLCDLRGVDRRDMLTEWPEEEWLPEWWPSKRQIVSRTGYREVASELECEIGRVNDNGIKAPQTHDYEGDDEFIDGFDTGTWTEAFLVNLQKLLDREENRNAS